jgi:cell division protein FtsW (lipid II flippase)
VAEKTKLASFQAYFGSFCVVWLIAIILQFVLGGSFVLWLPGVVAAIMAIVLRIHIVRKHQIRECGNNQCCNEVGEVCCMIWCYQCSVCQSKLLLNLAFM